MEHRLRSPSRTYSDIPETRRVNAYKRPQSQYSPAQSSNSAESEQPNAILQAKKNGIFIPSSDFDEEELFLHMEPTVQANQSATDNASVNLDQNDSPRPGCSRDVSGPREGFHQRGNSIHQYAIVRPSTSRGYVRNDNVTETRDTADTGNYDDVEVIVVEDSDSDSDSSADSSKNRHFFKDSRLPYSAAEDEEILQFVLTGNNIEKTSSILLWKELESRKENPKRTFHSLKNRFLRNIKPFVLTRFKHMLTAETLKMLRRKFPELRITDQKKYTPVRTYDKRVVCVNPSMEGIQRPFYADRHFGIINVTNIVDPDDSEPEKTEPEKNDRPSVFPGVVNPHIREWKDSADGGNSPEDNEESTEAKINDEADEVNEIWPEPGPSTHQLERVVNIFAKEKLLDVPVQSFKYYDTISPFSNTAAVNLKLILDRTGSESLPADLPVSVNVTVTVGQEDENQTKSKSKSLTSKDRDNLRAKKERMKKRRDAKKGSKKGLQRGYILKVKEKYIKKIRNNTKWYIKAADSLMYKVQLEKVMENMKNNAITLSSDSHSDAEPPADENQQESNSQNTNCSTEDESCYTQTLQKVSHMYRVEVRPTQSLIEDESEEFLVSSAPTPPPVENPLAAGKGTLEADAVLMCKDFSPSDSSLFQPGKV